MTAGKDRAANHFVRPDILRWSRVLLDLDYQRIAKILNNHNYRIPALKQNAEEISTAFEIHLSCASAPGSVA